MGKTFTGVWTAAGPVLTGLVVWFRPTLLGLLLPFAAVVLSPVPLVAFLVELFARVGVVPGGRVVELEAVRYGHWTGVRLVDVRSGERAQGYLHGRCRPGEVCLVDSGLGVVARASPIVRGLSRARTPPTTHHVTAPWEPSGQDEAALA